MVQIFKVSYTVFKDAATYATVYYHINPKADGYILGTGNSDIVYSAKITELSDISDFAITLEPTAIVTEEEEDVLALPTLSQGGILQSKFDIGETTIYIGKARQNVATSATGWTITRFLLVGGNATEKKITVQDAAIWDNRATETYQ